MKINKERLEKNLFSLGEIGRNSAGGIDRALSSKADEDARNWLIRYWSEHLGQDTSIDAIANLWTVRKGKKELPLLAIGSHHDAVTNGGMYDGALGVLAATEVLETLIENHYKTKHPLAIVSFTGEEPNPYNVSTLGSKVLSGRLTKDDLLKLKHQKDGSSLQECIGRLGGNIEKADEIKIKPEQIHAFVELHIEQGKRLFKKKQSCATVSCITGIYRENISVLGDANHGGTTIMPDRNDALLAACEWNLAFEELVKKVNDEEVVGTVGQLSVFPNAVSIIPGKVELVMEIRTCKPEIRAKITTALNEVTRLIEEKRGVTIERKLNLDQPAMPMDPVVMSAISRGIEAIHEPNTEYISMAGHDAANMQRVTRAGMLFVQSTDGKSHCPQEHTDIEAIEQATNALLETVLLLDEEMDADENL